MKNAEEIKDFVAKDYLYHDYKTALDLFQKGAISQVAFNEFINDVIKEACREALKNASENATYFLDANDQVQIVKSSITSEENIPSI